MKREDFNFPIALDAMVECGCTPRQIVDVVKAFLAQQKRPVYVRRLDVSAQEWVDLRCAVLDRDEFTCVYCGSDGDGLPLHCDHVVPLSQGGESVLANLVAACRSCNLAKRARTPAEWARKS